LFFLQEVEDTPDRPRLLAFAPTYDNLDDIDTSKFLASRDYIDYLVPLKYIKEEIGGISEVLDADVFLDYDATEQVFWNKAGDYNILHFAMHTLINDANPMFSQLVFTLTNDTVEDNDGLLNTYEIYNMNLNARLAVLSACNTGYGKLQKGEGIMSLARGFIYAGVPSIIMTLWAVEDQSGAELMTRFYKFLSEGDAIDEALRKAKLEYLSTADQLRSHPYLWASYVSIGKVEPIYHRGLSTVFVLAGAALIITGLLIFLSCKKRRKKLLKRRDPSTPIGRHAP
jgi:CHAT domain-containing protein